MVGHEHAGPCERDLADQEAGCNLDDLGEDGEWVAGGWSSPQNEQGSGKSGQEEWCKCVEDDGEVGEGESDGV